MLELAEAVTLAAQMNESVKGREITTVEAGGTPHKFAFFSKAGPGAYPGLLNGRRLGEAVAMGGMVELPCDDTMMLFGDGVRLRLHAPGEALPPKRQLLLGLSDGSALVATIQMYGGMWAIPYAAGYDNPYYLAAKEKPSPLSPAFDEAYFMALAAGAAQNLSAKAFLATEQRIPGLGNGALHDILLAARVHPRRKLETLDDASRRALFASVKDTLAAMAAAGGRDTEKDLYGAPGGYKTLLNSKSAGAPCPLCGAAIVKQNYLGGSIYFCPACQPL